MGWGDSVSALHELCLVVERVHVVGASEPQWERGKGIHQPRLQVWVGVLDQVSKLFKKNRSWVK